MKIPRKLLALGMGTAALAALAAVPASAQTVDVSLTTGGTRTLNLYEPDGHTNLTSTDLSSGSSNFIAQVVDSTYDNKGFTVQATMSNLYPYANSAYDCSGTPIPSSAITLSSPTGLLTVGGVSAATTPAFTATGTLTPTNVTGLLVSSLSISDPVDGQLPNNTPLTQTQLAGTANDLVGSALTAAASKLPIDLGAATGGAFTNPDVHPTCDPNASGPTPQQVMQGTANAAGLLTDLVNEIVTAVGTDPTLAQLVSAGYLTDSEVESALQNDTTLVSDLGLTNLTDDLSQLESDLTASITTTAVSLLSGTTSQSGTYEAGPSLAVSVPTGSKGTYKGVMTVTLIDG